MEGSEDRAVVVRRPGSWSVGSLQGDGPATAALPQVLALLAPPTAPVAPASGPADLDEHRVVREVWTWVGLVVGEHVVLEGVDGERLLLDRLDLVLLDRCDGLRTGPAVAEAARVPWTEAAARLARLVDAGRLRTEVLPPAATATPPPAEPHGPSAEAAAPAPAGSGGLVDRARTAYRLSSKLAPVRRLLDRHPAPEAIEAGAPSEPATGPPADADDVGAPSTAHDGRIPVYAVWHQHVGPLLSLGLLTSAARAHDGGALDGTYEVRRPETAESFLDHLATVVGPAVLLLSDYVWSVEENLDLARRALALHPELLVVHGGPSCPKYEADAEAFLDEHGAAARILVRGEGEEVVCELLERLVPLLGAPQLDLSPLADVAGITFRRPTGEVVRTPERDRIVDLDGLPSPYLTGEFDHIGAEAWNYCLPVETTRGCPYGCTFCDWGSSTLSRIRKFGDDRVRSEIDWAAERGIVALNVADANFGIMKRDVETTRHIAEAKRRTGFPEVLVFYPAKNTTKHLVRIMDLLGEASISSAASLSLQTIDDRTLDALDRANIPTAHFVALAADYRRRGHPLQGDLLVGIPEQTYASYRNDLQFMLDHEILSRTWPVQLLPNAPMNEPGYRARHGIASDDRQLVMSANSFTTEDRAAMLRLRNMDIVTERIGLLRHVMRYLQWDHGVLATTLMDHLLELVRDRPERFPSLAWTLGQFDLVPTAAVGWTTFYDEVRALLVEDLGIRPSSALETVLAVQAHLMPQPGRTFPSELALAHDYVAYYKDATAGLHTDGHAGGPPRPLDEYGPGTLRVAGDPLGLCEHGIAPAGDSRSETMQGDYLIGSSIAYELDSPLLRLLPHVATFGLRSTLFDDVVAGFTAEAAARPDDRAPDPVPVSLGATSSRRADPAAVATPADGG